MVTAVDVLDHLDALGITTSIRGGRLTTSARPGAIDETLAAQIRQHRDMVLAIIVGRCSGHAPGVCTECGAVSLIAGWDSKGQPRQTWPTCRLTPGCDGEHQPRALDLNRTVRRPTPKQAAPPPSTDKHRLLGAMPPWPDNEGT